MVLSDVVVKKCDLFKHKRTVVLSSVVCLKIKNAYIRTKLLPYIPLNNYVKDSFVLKYIT